MQELLDTEDWLMEGVPLLPAFNEILSELVMLVLDACAIETDPTLLVTYISFLSLHLPDNQLIPMVTLLSSILCKRFRFLKNVLTDFSPLLSRFAQAFDMFLSGSAMPPESLTVDDLRMLCLPEDCSGDRVVYKEIVIQWDFLNSLWLLLSLSSQDYTEDVFNLVRILCPKACPIKVLDMVRREPQSIHDDNTLKYIFSGSNSGLIENVVNVATSQSLIYYVCSLGIPVANIDIMIKELIKRGITPNDELMKYVEGHCLRGSVSARKLLESWGVPNENLQGNLRDMLELPKPRRRRPSFIPPEQSMQFQHPNFSKVFLDPSATSETITYILINHDKLDKIADAIAQIIKVLKSPTDRKVFMKHLELNEFSCLLLSLLKRFSVVCGIEVDEVLVGIEETMKRSSHVLLNVLHNLTRTYSDEPHESIKQAMDALKTGTIPKDLLQSPISCDLIDIFDPELKQVMANVKPDGSNLLKHHILQRSIHRTFPESGDKFIQTLLQLKPAQ